MIKQLRIVNPLPQALAYYTMQLEETLQRIDVRVDPVVGRAVERGELDSALQMAWGSVANVASLRSGPSVQVWPSLGLVEGRIWGREDFVIFHDPVPIRHQHGYGKIAETIARAPRWMGRGPTLVAHSSDAASEMRRLFPSARIELAFHPVRTNLQPRTSQTSGSPRVLVAGQYKPTRDVELLLHMGRLLAARGFDPVIVGRGWPAIEGWSVCSDFVSEEELAREIAGAAVLLLPYTRYFQSGIALRALELGTPVALARNSFANHIVGDGPGLFSPGDSAQAVVETINDALTMQRTDELLADYRRQVDESWANLLSGP